MKQSIQTVWNRSFFPVLSIYFVDTFGLAIVYPIFTPLFLEPKYHLLGLDTTTFHRTFLLGLLIASFPLAQFFGAPLFGELSDRFGRRRIFLWTISGGVIGYILTGYGIHIRNLHWMWIGRAMAGFFAGNLTLCLASIADISQTKRQRARNFGWIGSIGGIGFVLAILAGASLSNPNLAVFFHPEIPFFLTGMFLLVNLSLIIAFFKEPRITKPHDRIEFFKSLKKIVGSVQIQGIRPVYAAYFLFMICWFTSVQFLSATLIDDYNVTTNTITLTFAFVGIVWFIANFIIHPLLIKWIAPHRTFLFGLLFLGTFLFLTLIPHQPIYLFLTHFFIATLAAALAWTNGLATVSLTGSKLIQGSLLGVNQSIIAIATICGPIVGGYLAATDIHHLYLFTASCSIAGAVLLLGKK